MSKFTSPIGVKSVFISKKCFFCSITNSILLTLLNRQLVAVTFGNILCVQEVPRNSVSGVTDKKDGKKTHGFASVDINATASIIHKCHKREMDILHGTEHDSLGTTLAGATPISVSTKTQLELQEFK